MSCGVKRFAVALVQQSVSWKSLASQRIDGRVAYDNFQCDLARLQELGYIERMRRVPGEDRAYAIDIHLSGSPYPPVQMAFVL
jgi:hypothetical protein